VAGDPAGKHALLVMGANHNFYNTVWTPGLFPAGAEDDWNIVADPVCGTVPGSERLTPDQQQADGLVSVASFFRTYIGHEPDFLSRLATGTFSHQIDPATVHASYHPPDQPSFRRDLNRFQDQTSLTTSAVGGAIAENGLMPYSLCGGGVAEPTPCLPNYPASVSQPHYDGVVRHGLLSQLITGWNDRSATYTYFLPPGSRDVGGFQALQFRAGVNFTDIRNFHPPPPPPHPFRVPDPDPQDLTITMMDGTGTLASVKVSQAAPGSLFFPPGPLPAGGYLLPRSVLNAVRIPLKAFGKLDLSDIRQIDFKFNRNATGGLMLTDMAFTSIPPQP
jgi:hypothetical protein